MSTRPIRSRSAPTCSASVTSTVALSTPCAVAPLASSWRRIAAPMPCAVPVTSAVLPERSGIAAPAALDHLAYLFDARLPDAKHVLVGTLVDAARGAVAEEL